MIASLIGAGLSAAGSIFGGLKASQAMKKVKDSINEQKQRNENWFNQRYNEDATQRADAQAIITKTEEAIKARNRSAAGAQAVMGGTEESVAATKAANSQAMADATAQIAVAGDRRKDAIESQYQQRDAQLVDSENNMEINRANEISKSIGGVMSAGGNIAGFL